MLGFLTESFVLHYMRSQRKKAYTLSGIHSFFITLLAFNLAYSQYLQIFPSKDVILFAIFMFEIGSLICGVAPSMDVLILGRAVAGLGAAGIFTCGIVILAEVRIDFDSLLCRFRFYPYPIP